jgi:DNA repair protein RadC
MTRTLKYRNLDDLVSRTGAMLEQRMVRERTRITNADLARNLIRLKIGHLEHEEFAVIYLDQTHRFIAFERMFRGTVNSCAVYPREIAKAALRCNAAAVILAHNHPSGDRKPSAADELLTDRLTEALGLIDVRVVDHLVVNAKGCTGILSNRAKRQMGTRYKKPGKRARTRLDAK